MGGWVLVGALAKADVVLGAAGVVSGLGKKKPIHTPATAKKAWLSISFIKNPTTSATANMIPIAELTLFILYPPVNYL